jgi:sec-independent protein translocase protein TatB
VPFNIGAGEILLILLVALIVLGPDKLPGAARQVGRTVGELRRLSTGFQAELKDALKEPVEGTPATAASGPAPKAKALPPAEADGSEPEVDAGPLAAPKRPAPAKPVDTEPEATQPVARQPEPAEGPGTNGTSPAS